MSHTSQPPSLPAFLPHHQPLHIGQSSQPKKPEQTTLKSTLKIEEDKGTVKCENAEATEEEKVKRMTKGAKKFQNYFSLLVKVYESKKKIQASLLSELENEAKLKIFSEVDNLIRVSETWLNERESLSESERKQRGKEFENRVMNERVQKIPETYNYEDIIGAVKKE